MTSLPAEAVTDAVARERKTRAADAAASQDAIAARVRRFAMQDRLFLAVTFSFAALVLAGLTGILVSLVIEAWPAIREYGRPTTSTAR